METSHAALTRGAALSDPRQTDASGHIPRGNYKDNGLFTKKMRCNSARNNNENEEQVAEARVEQIIHHFCCALRVFTTPYCPDAKPQRSEHPLH